MTGTDKLDRDGYLPRHHRRGLSQNWPSYETQMNAQMPFPAATIPVAYHDPIDLDSWPPHLERPHMNANRNYDQDIIAQHWSCATRDWSQQAPRQDQCSPLRAPPFGQSSPSRPSPDTREIGSWVPDWVDEMWNIPATAMLNNRASLATTVHPSFIDAEQTELPQYHSFVRAPVHNPPQAGMHRHDVAISMDLSYPRAPPLSPDFIQLGFAVSSQERRESVFEAETGQPMTLPTRRKQRPRNQTERHNRELIRRLGGACPACKSRKRKVRCKGGLPPGRRTEWPLGQA